MEPMEPTAPLPSQPPAAPPPTAAMPSPVPPRRPVWLAPALVAGAAIVVVIVIALVMRSGDDDATAGKTAATSTTSKTGAAALSTDSTRAGETVSGADADSPNDPNAPAVDPDEGPNVPVSLDTKAPDGSRAHPFAIGTAGGTSGWQITVQSVGGDGAAITGNVLLRWAGREGAATGDASKLVLRIEDAEGHDHPLGGAACPGDPAGELAKVGALGEGHTATVALCWTADGLDRSSAAMVAEDADVADSAFFAVA